MIYDAFIFFNELELLEVRLNELAGIVDKFVLVEATHTFTGKPKVLFFQENRDRFKRFESKIIHVVVADSPSSSDPWTVETFQRNCIARGLTQCKPNDWVLISDLDEIPRGETVAKVCREHPYPQGFWSDWLARPLIRFFTAWKFSQGRVRRNHPFILRLQQSNHRHFINCVTVNPPKLVHWHGTRMLFYKDLITAQIARHSGYKTVENGGWHFTCMGGVERIRKKIESYSHQEFNREDFLNPDRIQKTISQGLALFDSHEELRFMPFDDSYPLYLREHPEKFAEWIRGV